MSPHDSTGTNLIVQVKGAFVMRVLPLENEDVNECWIADRDRFSYEALADADRLTAPMIKQGGVWRTVDWTTALEYVARGLTQIAIDHGPQAIGAVASPTSPVEELHLLGKLVRGLGSENIDFRSRHADFANAPAADGPVARWLGTSIASLSTLQSALVVGSFLRKDHPLFAQRIRQAAKKGCKVHALHALRRRLADAEGRQPGGRAQPLGPGPGRHRRRRCAASQGVDAPGARRGRRGRPGHRGIAAGGRAQGRSCSAMPRRSTRRPASCCASRTGSASAAERASATSARRRTASAPSWSARCPARADSMPGRCSAPVARRPLKACLLLNVEPALDAANGAAATGGLRTRRDGRGADLVPAAPVETSPT